MTSKRSDRPAGKRKPHKLPPDPWDLNEDSATRARAVITIYQSMSGSDRETLVRDLLHDVMHLCDRERDLGDFGQQHRWAVNLYGAITLDPEKLPDE